MHAALVCLSLAAAPLLASAQYTPQPRWGQAAVLLDNVLLLHGGKTDPSNGQSYTSAPTNADVILLDLSQPFDASQAPWQLVNSATNDSSVRGPAVAWHTLNAVNSSHVLLFGGVPDANGQPPVVGLPDSAAILDAFNRLAPAFTLQPSLWANEPARRVHHTGVSSRNGQVYIIGGEKPDNANFAYSDNYVFDINGPSFTQISPGLPDVTGHCSVILPDGRIVVLGGYSPSSSKLLDFSTVYELDLGTPNSNWSTVSTSGTPPGGRRNFACTLFGDNRIFVHGGSDGSHQTVYPDGFVLDLSQSTWTWSSVSALSQLGARSDHFAVASGDEIIFGFGYGSSNPASTPLQVFYPNGGSSGNSGSGSGSGGGTWSGSHTPPPVTGGGSPSQTVPGPQGTPTNSNPNATGTGGVHPTSTDGQGSGGNSGDDKASTSRTTAIAVGTALGICAALVAGAIVTHRVRKRRRIRRQFMALSGGDDENAPPGGIPAATIRGEKQPYRILNDDPTQGGLGRDILGALGVPALAAAVNRATSRTPRGIPERRDMLADEDTRDFGFGAWYDRQRRDGTGGSSWSLGSILKGRMRREGSTNTVTSGYANYGPVTPYIEKDVDPFSDGAALLRDAETGYTGSAAPAAAYAAISRPAYDRRQSSFNSAYSYSDPFADPFADPQPARLEPQRYGNVGASSHMRRYTDDPMDDVGQDLAEPMMPHRRPLQPPSALDTALPLAGEAGHRLSPLTEQSSRGTLPLGAMDRAPPSSASNSSHGHASSQHDSSHGHTKSSSFDRSTNRSPFDTLGSHSHEGALTSSSRVTSLTSLQASGPSSPKAAQSAAIASYFNSSQQAPRPASSLIDDNQRSTQPMRRSDSWWSRFARTSLLDRRSSDAGRRGPSVGGAAGMFEFRDPNPAPARLGAIEESMHSASPEDSPHGSKPSPQRTTSLSRKTTQINVTSKHGKSMSSLRTLDSDQIEGMGTMNVVQRVMTGSGSQRTRESTGSWDSHLSGPSHMKRGSSLAEEPGYWTARPGEQDSTELVASPTEIALPESAYSQSLGNSSKAPSQYTKQSTPSPLPSPNETASEASSSNVALATKTPRPPSGSAVAARVNAYEKRVSIDNAGPPPPTNTRAKEERSRMSYGLAPRPSLFVANPDKKEGSGDS